MVGDAGRGGRPLWSAGGEAWPERVSAEGSSEGLRGGEQRAFKLRGEKTGKHRVCLGETDAEVAEMGATQMADEFNTGQPWGSPGGCVHGSDSVTVP